VQRLAVREGDAVTPGQVIALVETAPLQDQAAAAAGSLAGARVAVTSAQATVARLEPLVAHGIAAQQELDDARARLAQARAAVAAGQGVARVAAHEVGRGTVRAPIAGVVLRVLRGVGDLVDGTPNTPIVELGDPAALEFVANATAADIVALRAGQPARVVLGRDDAAARAATVDRVALAVDPLTGIGAVRLRFADATAMPNGMTGAARVTVAERAGVSVVPAAALRAREGDRAEVIVCLANHHASVREVTLGVADEGFVEVREGLEPADRVVLDRVVGIEDEAALQEGP
jgi:RND family efflux transporter MFP subunit